MSLEIIPVTDAGVLPNDTPSLMPFHISYNGPAPVSRYFRPKPAPSFSPAIPPTGSSSLATLVAGSSSGSQLSEGDKSIGDATVASKREGSAMDVDCDTQPISTSIPRDDSSASTLVTPPSNNVERFVAAFRGRQMYGQAVAIPEGYGGLVLRTPVGEKGKGKDSLKSSSKAASQKAKSKPKSRVATRRSRRAAEDDGMDGLEEDEEDENDYAASPIDPLPPAKGLVPASTFSSFTLWTPDIPLDEGKDEYVRALIEWPRLAAEIHSYDE